MQLFDLVDVAQEMNPTALMPALVTVVAGVNIAAHDAGELVADQAVDHFPSAGVMLLVVAHRWSAHAPDISIEAIFSPSRFIGLHGGAGSDVRCEIMKQGAGMPHHTGEHLNDLSHAHLDSMPGGQQVSDLSDGQAHHRAQGGNQADQSYAQPSLPQDLFMQIHRSLLPVLALRTPAVENPMVDHFHRRRGRHIDDFSHPRQREAAQPQVTGRAGHDAMLHELCRHRTRPPVSVPPITLLARLLFFRGFLFHVCFDKLRGRRLLLFQFLDAG